MKVPSRSVIRGRTRPRRGSTSTLQSLGLRSAVAKSGIEVEGVGVVPFRTVLSLHRSSPELFQTGGVTVVVGGQGCARHLVRRHLS